MCLPDIRARQRQYAAAWGRPEWPPCLLGIYTALSMILAEELDAPFEHVTAVAAPPNDKLYANPQARARSRASRPSQARARSTTPPASMWRR